MNFIRDPKTGKFRKIDGPAPAKKADKRVEDLLRQVRAICKVPAGMDPARAAALRAVRLALEALVVKHNGAIPLTKLHWAIKTADELRQDPATAPAKRTGTLKTAAVQPNGQWERLVAEARGYDQPQPVESSGYDSKTDPTDQDEAPDDSAIGDSVEPAADDPSVGDGFERVAQPFVPRLVLPGMEDDTSDYKTVEERLLERIEEITQELKHSMPPRLPEDDPRFPIREAARDELQQQQRDLQAERARLNEELLGVQGRWERRVRESDPNAGRVINHRPGRPDSEDDAPVGGRSSWDLGEKRGRGRAGWLDW